MFFKINGYKVIKKNKKNPTKMRSYFSIIQIKLRTAYMLKLNTETGEEKNLTDMNGR